MVVWALATAGHASPMLLMGLMKWRTDARSIGLKLANASARESTVHPRSLIHGCGLSCRHASPMFFDALGEVAKAV